MVTATIQTKSLYSSGRHPYRILEHEALRHVGPQSVLLDAGCGHNAPVLTKLAPHVARAIGVDEGASRPPGVEYIQADLAYTGLERASVDLVVSRSVLEHLQAPLDVFREIHRILRPGGRFIFLTPNRWDYVSLAALAIPNRLHPWIVRRLTDRKECDTFPTFYRANTKGALRRLAVRGGFEVDSIQYLNESPHYLEKIPPLYLLGAAYERLTSAWERLEFLRGWILGTLVKK